MMNAREKVALKSGDIKVFLMPQEVALVISCLNWVKTEIMKSADDWERMNSVTKKDLPIDLLTSSIPAVDSTIDSILLHSRAHYVERHNEEGWQLLKARIDHTEEVNLKLHLIVTALHASVSTNDMGMREHHGN